MVSVIVPIFGVENYLKRCVDSIIAQTYKELEIILVDDGSPDNCPKICDEYAISDSRVKVVHKQNGGLMSARQAGLRVATGEYVTFVDGDDWIETDMYQKIHDSAKQYHPDIVYCEFLYDYGDRQEKSKQSYGTEFLDKKMLENKVYPTMIFKPPYYSFGINPCCWSKMFKKSLLEKCLYPVPQSVKIGEDAAFTYPALIEAQSVSYVGDYLYHYRINPDSMTKKYDANMENYIKIPFDILSKLNDNCPYDLSNQLSFYLLFLINGIIRNEASPSCKKTRSDIIKTLKKFTRDSDVTNAAKSVDVSVLPLHTRLVAKFLAMKNADLLYLYTKLLRRYI